MKLIGRPQISIRKWSSQRDILMKHHNQRQTEFLKQQEKKNLLYKWTLIKLSAEFSTETLQVRREQNDIFQVLKEEICQARIFYLKHLSFKWRQDKYFPNKSWGTSLPLDLPYKKCWKEFVKIKDISNIKHMKIYKTPVKLHR